MIEEQWTYRGQEGRASAVAFLLENYQTGSYSSARSIEREEHQVHQFVSAVDNYA